MVDVFREGLPLSTANTKVPKIVCPEGLQDGLARPGRRTLKGDLALANVESSRTGTGRKNHGENATPWLKPTIASSTATEVAWLSRAIARNL